MSTKTTKKVEEKQPEKMSYKLTFPDGTTAEGELLLRPFKKNEKNNCINSGYQTKISNGNYSGSIMIIDYLKQVPA